MTNIPTTFPHTTLVATTNHYDTAYTIMQGKGRKGKGGKGKGGGSPQGKSSEVGPQGGGCLTVVRLV